MYKFVGFGLLAFLALLIIPVSSATQSDDPSMYGMATVSLKDESGNILIENQIHNEVVDQGTAWMLNQTFTGGTWTEFVGRVNGICVSDAGSFSTADSETPTTFNDANSIDNPFKNCNVISSWNPQTSTSITTTSSFVADSAFSPGTTITGIGVCGIPDVSPPNSFLDCTESGTSETIVLFSLIDIPDTAIGGGFQLDVTYSFNLD